ncbi:hypothetical protein GCM10009131_09020 [Morganella psychrotolerans]
MSLRRDLSAVISLKKQRSVNSDNRYFTEFQENGSGMDKTDYLIVWLPEWNKFLTIGIN